MADDALSFGAGLLLGIVVVAVILWIIRQEQQSSDGGLTPQMTSYNVVRDDQGRIQSVDSLSGLPLEGQQSVGPTAMIEQQAPEPEPQSQPR